MLNDLRSIFRTHRKNPASAIIVILTLALGVGVNTAMLSVVHFVLLRPLPIQDPDRVVVMAEQRQGESRFLGLSYPDLTDFRAQSADVAELAAYQVNQVGLRVGGKTERAVVIYLSGNFFSTLGVKPAVGRLISPTEGNAPNTDPIVVIGYSYWQKNFHGDRGIVGKSVSVNGRALTVVGVSEERFHGPYALADIDAYLPFSMAGLRTVSGEDPTQFWTKRDGRNLRVLARLKPGLSMSQAQAGLNVVARRLADQYPATNKDLSVRLVPERLARPEPSSAGRFLPIVAAFFMLMALAVLLVACLNVANILLVRAVGRRQEMALRTALGASRWLLIRHSLAESIILAMLGGLVGIALGQWACNLLGSLRYQIDLPLYLNFTVDWTVFAYSFALALLTGIGVGLFISLRVSRTDIRQELLQSSRGSSAGTGQRKLRDALVIVQNASSLMLIIVAGLFFRSLEKAQQLELGFNPNNILNVSMDPRLIGYDDRHGKTFYRDLETRIRSLPGVQSASLAFSAPFGLLHESSVIRPDGRPLEPGKAAVEITYNAVTPPYFDNLKIRLVRGRLFAESDDEKAPPVAVVNQTMAQQLWPNQNAIGKRFGLGANTNGLLEVVGITADGRYLEPSDVPEPYFFVPAAQHYVSIRTLQVRTASAPQSMIPRILAEIHTVSPEMPTFDVRSMTDSLNGLNGFLFFRAGAAFAAALGLLGLALAMIGVYGVVSYSVSQRGREIAIRIALGASPVDVVKTILKQGLIVVGFGTAFGLLLALASSHLIAGLLVGVGANDPITFVAASTALACVSLSASIVPARRALRTDPMNALRND